MQSYFAEKERAAACMASRLLRSPLLMKVEPSFFECAGLIKEQRRAAEAARKVEEARPPNFEIESLEEAKKRKARKAMRALDRAARLHKCDWLRPEDFQMGYKPIKEVAERRAIGREDFVEVRRFTLKRRVIEAEQKGYATMRIAGLVVPAINGYFFEYLPKLGERRSQWRARMFRLRRSLNIGKAIQKQEDALDLPLYEQIKRQAQRVGTLKNRFSKLQEVELSGPSSVLVPKLIHSVNLMNMYRNRLYHLKESKPKVFGPVQKFRVEYQEECLKRKLRLSLFQQEWKEAKFLRKEKMVRAIIKIGDHKFKSLKAHLVELAYEFVKNNKLNAPEALKAEGEMFSMFSKASDLTEKVDKVVDKIDDKLIEDIKDTSNNVKGITQGLKDMVTNYIPSLESIQNKAQKWISLIINAITNLCHCLINFNLKSLGLSVISFLVQLKVVCFSFTELIASKIKGLFSFLSRDTSPQPLVDSVIEGNMALPEDDKAKEKDSLICGYISTLVAAVSALFAFVPKFCKARYDELGSLLMSGIGKFAYTANHLYTFVKNNLICVKHIGEWLFSDHPSIKKLGFLKQHQDIYEWAELVVEYTDPRKENAVFTNPIKASKAYILAAQAGILQIKMMDLNLNNTQTNVMNILIKKINDLRDRLAKTHTAPPVRFEPFVYELTGKTGIGKSELLKVLPYELFKALGLKHEGELIYHRQIGNAYWNNLRNQPVCTIDEKFPIDAPGFSDVQLAELFQLKSSCVFNPPMADIPDKGIRYNPIIVQGSSNDPFPELAGVKDKHAIYRRRDLLYRVTVKESIRVDCGGDCTYAQIKSKGKLPPGEFGHLHFWRHIDPKSGNDSTSDWIGPLDYSSFLKELIDNFKSFFVSEEKKFRKELQRMMTVMPNAGEESSLKDLFDYKWLSTIESTSPDFDENIAKFRDQYTGLKSYAEKREIYKLKLRLMILEWFSPNSEEEIRKVNADLYRLENNIDSSPTLILNNNPIEPVDKVKAIIEMKEMGQKKIEQLQSEIQAISEGQQKLNSILVAEGNGNDPSKVPCIHKILFENLTYFSGSINFIYDKNSWEFEVSSPQHVEGLYQAIELYQPSKTFKEISELFKDCKASNFDLDSNKIFIEHKSCNKDDCLFKNNELRRNFVSNYLKLRIDIANRLTMGLPCRQMLPDEFLDIQVIQHNKKIEEHKKLEEKLPEVKSYWQKFKESFYNIKWTKWLKKLAIAISIFSFIGAIVGLWNYYSGSNDSLKEVSLAVSAGASGVAASSNLERKSDFSNLCNEITEIVKGEGHVSGDHKVSKHSKSSALPAVKSIMAFSSAKGNSISGLLNEDVITNKILRNTFFIDFASDIVPRNPGRCLGICGHYAIVVDHYMDSWKYGINKIKDDNMLFIPVIDGRVSCVEFKLSEVDYMKIENSALGIIKLPKRMGNFKDIRKFILPQKSHRVLNKSGTVAETMLSRHNIINVSKVNVDFEPYDDDRIIDVQGCELWKPFKVYNSYHYEGFSGRGRCGSVLLAHGMQASIVGIHVAGFSGLNMGISDVIYREMFDHLGSPPDPVDIIGDGKLSNWFVDANVISLGKVPAQFAHQERGTSRIVPSKVQLIDKNNLFKVYTQPAVLDKFDKRLEIPFSPMLEGCKHHGKPLIPFNQNDINLAINDLKNLILTKCVPQRQNVGRLSVDEAIGGFDGKPGYEHIEFSTSEGFPFVGLRPKGFSNKKWLFNFNEDNKYVSCNKILTDVLEVKWQQRLNNKIPATVFVDCLKDCTIPHEKVLEPGKTRIFSMSSVDFTIQQRQCTLDFVVSYMTNRLNLEHMVGCNPDSFEWTLLSRKLLEVGNNILTGDYSKYGDSLPFEFILGAFEIIRDWYQFYGCKDQEMFQQLQIMPYEIGNSVHLMFDHTYRMVCGQPSGNSLTVILNSIANSLYMRVAYLNIMRNSAFPSLNDFCKNTRVFSYGDDLIVSLSDDIKELFNAQSVCEFFAKHLLKFTNADKSNNIVKYVPLFEAEFLKRKFLIHPYRTNPRVMLAPLGLPSIEDTVNWVWKESFMRSDPNCPTFLEMSLQVCQDSLRNAFGRGPEYYNEWRSKLSTFWLNRGIRFIADEWEQMDHKIFNLNMDLSPYHKWQINVPKANGEMGVDKACQVNPWSMPNSPEFPRKELPKFTKVSKDDYQGYGPHDWHWAPQRALNSLRFLRDLNNNNEETQNLNIIVGQMADEGDAQGTPDAKVEKKSNVEIQQQVGSSIASALPGGTVKNSYSDLSAAESKISDSTFHDRWYTIRSKQWDNSQNSGSEFLRLNCPKDILEDKKFKTSPNYTAFAKHMFNSFRTLRVKIICNCNVRQYGQIQWSFYYGSEQDYLFEQLRNNIYSASQRLHALMTANSSNEVIMDIPFEYVFPMMAINKVKMAGYKSLGVLIGLIVIPLKAPSGCPQEASVKVLISFEGNRFAGMVGQQIAEANMFSMGALASVIAVKSMLDKNRDAPTYSATGMPVIPINSSSWCYGTGQATYNNILRLNPNKVLPYEEGRIPNIDEMTIEHVRQQFGMIGIFEWKNSDPVGKFLFALDATPLTDLREYHNIQFQDQNVFIVPPVGVLSSLFAYWRGSLELRIDIVGAKELSGSILVCYIPQYNSDDHSKIEMDDCFSCAHAIYDIHENRQFNFKIPYVASHMFWPRRSTLSNQYPTYAAPGAIFIYVYNKLIVNCTIPPECQMVCYLRGGDDFEVAIPASPSVGLAFNPYVYVPSTANKRVIPIEGYTPCYSGYWRYSYVSGFEKKSDFEVFTLSAFNKQIDLKLTTNYYTPVIRYSPVSDHITLFRTIHFTAVKDKVYLCKIQTIKKSPVTYKIDKNDKSFDAKAALISSDGNYIYARPISNSMIDEAKKALEWIDTQSTEDQKKYNVDMIWLGVVSESEDFDLVTVDVFEATSSDWWEPVDFYCTPIYPEDPQAEAGDEGTTTDAPVAEPQPTASSSVSDAVFGERFGDLKDLCRRYQLYASENLKIAKLLQSSRWRSIVIRFPVVPQGLDLDIGSPSSPNEYWNRTRDGPIPLIASGYRFFTGGIRFRVCINVSRKASSGTFAGELKGKIFVQHRPNIISTAKRVIVQSGVTLGTDDLELPGYAAYHQFEDLNNVLSIEVPFYQPSLRTYLQRPSKVDLAQRFSDLGELVIGLTVFDYEELNFSYDIYYSLADDARFSVFVGFPPLIDISKIAELEPKSNRTKLELEDQASKDDSDVLMQRFKSIKPLYKQKFKVDITDIYFKSLDLEHKRRVLDKWERDIASSANPIK